MLRFWLDRGVDGVRIDAAHRLGKDSRPRDNPAVLAGRRTDLDLNVRGRFRHIDHPPVLAPKIAYLSARSVACGDARITHHAAVTIAASPVSSSTAQRKVHEARRLAFSSLCRTLAEAIMGE